MAWRMEILDRRVKRELEASLHAFDKKTQKTPARALETARERAKEVK